MDECVVGDEAEWMRRRSAQAVEESGTEERIGGPVEEVHQFCVHGRECVVEAVSAAGEKVCQEENTGGPLALIPPCVAPLTLLRSSFSSPGLLLMLIVTRRRDPCLAK